MIALDEASAAHALSDTDLEMAAAIVRTRFDEASDHLEALWIDRAQRSLVLLVGTSKVSGLGERLREMSTDLSQHWWVSDDGRNTHLEVGTGWFLLDDRQTRAEYAQTIRETADATQISLSRRDLNSIPGHALGSGPRRSNKVTLTLQILGTFAIGFGAPFLLLLTSYHLGLDLTLPLYLITVTAMLFTAAMIWTECLLAMRPPRLPAMPDRATAPTASAIVAAYLPNEADTIIETLTHVLAQDYPGELQVILAYNTPVDLPIEVELNALAARYPELELYKVADSTSKAQNVNQPLRRVRGEFVGIFDADHHPDPGSFTRAWRWFSDGVDMVQGHCLIRNGAESAIARTVAVEFEQIYAVAHPGRAELHGFGIFGGSNGYWRTSVLRRMRMRVDRLTEDIDVAIRSVLAGHRLVSDPGLISRELAPLSMRALWRQRMRWAQGWFQVTRKTTASAMRSPNLTTRQRLGLMVLMPWREIYPWLSMLMVPIIGFMWVRDGFLEWGPPLFLMTTVYTLTCGPVQALFAWRLAAPEIQRHRSWFLVYVFLVAPLYNEWKNTIARVAQVKELLGEHEWHVTPRTASVSATTTAVPAERVDA